MDRFSYEELRERRPELSLPRWIYLTNTDRHRAKSMTVDLLIARRMWKLFVRSGDNQTVDRVRGQPIGYVPSLFKVTKESK